MTGSLGRIYRGETNIDFLGRRKLWFTLSGIVVLLCLVLLVSRGLNYGIEFVGGVSIQAPVSDPELASVSDAEVVSRVADELDPLGASDAQIQVFTSGADRTLNVQTEQVADPEEQARVVSAVRNVTGASVADTNNQRIGSEWGSEITSKAIRALIIFMLVVLVFISWRFEWKMAIAALIALIHDLLITAGIYSLVGFEVTPSTVIAILTILGYSLYDTVVVFDKVEEDTTALAATGRMTYQGAANLALNQVFMRSLNTSLATLLPVAALLFVGAGLLGAETLKDLSLALFVGLVIGAYSSIFVATPVLSLWKEREPKYRNVRAKVLRDAQRARSAPVGAEPGAVAARPRPAPGLAAASPRPAASASRSPSRPQAGSKKAKRRKRR
ncbi:MAG: protein translocase subunit SecF [Actinobacteria bacterium]|nr:protein translocase subunit SecF [Actinomycetota bacterium]